MAPSSLAQTVTCHCGKVRLAIQSPSVLRLVCYCKDCRGYIQTLNEKAHEQKITTTTITTTPLDPWGGVDWTNIYPSEIKVEQGQEHLAVCKIRESSKIKRVYAGCCHTPLFNIGEMSSLLNTHLVDDDKKADVRFRIIGRNAINNNNQKGGEHRPRISWSIPLSWPWVMLGRINKDKMQPCPVDISQPQVLEGFKQVDGTAAIVSGVHVK
jgi:hypothetical protein